MRVENGHWGRNVKSTEEALNTGDAVPRRTVPSTTHYPRRRHTPHRRKIKNLRHGVINNEHKKLC